MRGLPALTLASLPFLNQNTLSDTIVSTDASTGPTTIATTTAIAPASESATAPGTCQGTSTYTGGIPLQTVTVTVDGSYVFHRYGNDSRTPSAIFYTPPPACESVVVPMPAAASSIPSWESSVDAALGITIAPGGSQTTAAMNMTTYTSIFTWTETYTDSASCSPNLPALSSTINRGPPYANSSTSIDTAAAAATSCGPFLRFGTLTTTQTFVSAIATAAGGSSGPGHIRPQNPGAPNEGNTMPVVVTPVQPGISLTATVTITKKTPVEARPSTTAEQIVFPDSGPSISPVVNAPPPSKTSVPPLGGVNSDQNSNNAPSVPTDGHFGGKTRPATNSDDSDGSPQIPAATAISSAGNMRPASNQVNSAAHSDNGTPQSGGLGSIINSVINSPFTTVGRVTSYGAASVTANLVNGVPVQVEPSSVYIGGSRVAIPTGSSTALITVNQQTFTIVSGAVIGGSSTLAIHRSETVSSSPVQAITLAASTITQNGVVVTIEPTAAIVDGKTYSIGLNADSSQVVVNGQTVTFGDNGVAFGSTTYAPAMITASAYVVTTVGGLTFSLDSSQAIIDGTTYRIGSGALNTLVTTQIDGTLVTFGPSGIILPSKTIAPTGVSLTASGIGSAATSGLATARVLSGPTASQTLATGSATALLPNIHYIISILLAFSTLPLGLLL